MLGEMVMSMSANDVLKMIKDREVKFVDFRFTDTRGKEQHVGVPVKCMGMEKFEEGHAFDGSSIAGWKGIQASDMLLMPDPATAYIDPFMDETTLVIFCDVGEPAWSAADKFAGGNPGHRPTVKGGYFPVPPVDSLNDIRAAMCLALEACGVDVEVHHHEVATAGQCEIGTLFNTLVRRADQTQALKYVGHNVAHQYGTTAP